MLSRGIEYIKWERSGSKGLKDEEWLQQLRSKLEGEEQNVSVVNEIQTTALLKTNKQTKRKLQIGETDTPINDRRAPLQKNLHSFFSCILGHILSAQVLLLALCMWY